MSDKAATVQHLSIYFPKGYNEVHEYNSALITIEPVDKEKNPGTKVNLSIMHLITPSISSNRNLFWVTGSLIEDKRIFGTLQTENRSGITTSEEVILTLTTKKS